MRVKIRYQVLFVRVGIHNINEAAVYGMPVLFGPNYHKFKEAYDLIEAKGAFTFSDIVRFEGILVGDNDIH